jgi:hypothetical protein
MRSRVCCFRSSSKALKKEAGFASHGGSQPASGSNSPIRDSIKRLGLIAQQMSSGKPVTMRQLLSLSIDDVSTFVMLCECIYASSTTFYPQIDPNFKQNLDQMHREILNAVSACQQHIENDFPIFNGPSK